MAIVREVPPERSLVPVMVGALLDAEGPAEMVMSGATLSCCTEAVVVAVWLFAVTEAVTVSVPLA